MKCHATGYCGAPCQQAHWQTHKPLCHSSERLQSPSGERGARAFEAPALPRAACTAPEEDLIQAVALAALMPHSVQGGGAAPGRLARVQHAARACKNWVAVSRAELALGTLAMGRGFGALHLACSTSPRIFCELAPLIPDAAARASRAVWARIPVLGSVHPGELYTPLGAALAMGNPAAVRWLLARAPELAREGPCALRASGFMEPPALELYRPLPLACF